VTRKFVRQYVVRYLVTIGLCFTITSVLGGYLLQHWLAEEHSLIITPTKLDAVSK